MADEEKKPMTETDALTLLFDAGEQQIDRTGEEWPELLEALRIIGPKTRYGLDDPGRDWSKWGTDDEEE